MSNKTKPKCTACYDKGYYSIFTGGDIVSGPRGIFKTPQRIEKHPCPKCGGWKLKRTENVLEDVMLNGVSLRGEERARAAGILSDALEKLHGGGNARRLIMQARERILNDESYPFNAASLRTAVTTAGLSKRKKGSLMIQDEK